MRVPARLAALAVAAVAVIALAAVALRPSGSVAGRADPAAEGVDVHGHWVVEVLAQDGTSVARREFDNALTPWGKLFLSYVLSRQGGIGTWGILVEGSPQACLVSGSAATCLITESPAGTAIALWPGAAQFATLTIEHDPSTQTVKFRGTFNAQANGSITKVSSIGCFSLPRNADPTMCNNSAEFTTATLTSPVSVETGQQILVTIVLSFS